MKTILSFLGELQENNNRDWFNANKGKYLEAKTEFDSFIDAFIYELQFIDPRVAGATAKNSVFRIYKDTRFSRDKTPYKTHMGAYMISGGRKSQLPGYYLHIQPGGSFIAGGMYKPDAINLKKIRKEISLFPEDIMAVVNDPEFVRNYSLFSDDKLKRPPQGYSEDNELIELIKNRHFIASKNIPDKWLSDVKLLDACRGLLPLNDFLYRAVSS